MSTAPEVQSDYAAMLGYSEGARYRRMDLHTHTPASECSSFRLPKVIEDVLPAKTKKEGVYQEACYRLLERLAGGENPFAKPYNSRDLKSRPRLAARPALDGTVLRQIAAAWLADIHALTPASRRELSAAEEQEDRRQRADLVKLGIRDVRNYLASLFFPEEYVMRCYIEELDLVALTDHNHPGHIVPRLPRLGTWRSAIEEVNAAYVRNIRSGNPRGGKVRAAVVDRLRLARRRLKGRCTESVEADRETAANHKDRPKALRAAAARLAHVEERLAAWGPSSKPVRALTVLPGMEITVSNVHLLAVFPPRWYVPGRIASILRTIGIPEDQWGRGFVAAASSSVQDTITLVDDEGGIAIPAHSNSDFKGILRLFKKGLALSKVLEHHALLALETIGGTVVAGKDGKRGKDACETLRWLASGRARPHRDKPLSLIKGSDAHECRIELDGTGEDLGSRFTYVKLDIRPNDTPEEVFLTLRLALLSGQSRVIEWPVEDGYNYASPDKKHRVESKVRARLLDCEDRRATILGLTVRGAGSYAHGLKVRFNPHLNCVVGSGGKSTLVRLVGYAFGVQGFLPSTPAAWLPDRVRVFWTQDGCVYCVEREGRSIDPRDPKVGLRWLERQPDGTWRPVAVTRQGAEAKLAQVVEIWPSARVQDQRGARHRFEDKVIADLVRNLQFTKVAGAKPLLVNQPAPIFSSGKLFEAVLSKPLLKGRQMIWSTGSPNVPASLDAEKVIVTNETQAGKHMTVVCAGDLHEDEIRDQFLDHFEGGWLGFARRSILYTP